jgi:hypothetical protein
MGRLSLLENTAGEVGHSMDHNICSLSHCTAPAHHAPDLSAGFQFSYVHLCRG